MSEDLASLLSGEELGGTMSENLQRIGYNLAGLDSALHSVAFCIVIGAAIIAIALMVRKA